MTWNGEPKIPDGLRRREASSGSDVMFSNILQCTIAHQDAKTQGRHPFVDDYSFLSLGSPLVEDQLYVQTIVLTREYHTGGALGIQQCCKVGNLFASRCLYGTDFYRPTTLSPQRCPTGTGYTGDQLSDFPSYVVIHAAASNRYRFLDRFITAISRIPHV